MSIEEASMILERIKKDYGYDSEKAINMAIRSLEADRTVEKVLYAIREEMQYIKVAEQQIYGKGSWRFTSAVEDIINKHLKEVENKR